MAVFGAVHIDFDNVYTEIYGSSEGIERTFGTQAAPAAVGNYKEPLRFKIEATAGVATSPRTRGMGSIGMMALYYLESISSRRYNPYIEGGIGVIYTGFKVDGQGSKLNR